MGFSISIILQQEGFLEDQSEPATKGDRNLKYDVRNGVFNLFTKSYAEINCVMDFSLYPFDTQTCQFFVTAAKSKTYQELSWFKSRSQGRAHNGTVPFLAGISNFRASNGLNN